MAEIAPERSQQFARMRETAREIFAAALKNASLVLVRDIESAIRLANDYAAVP